MSVKNLIFAAAGAGAESDPNFNQTVLLLHGDGTNGAQNNTFLDSSTNNFTITRNGNTTQGTFSPFSAPDGRWSNFFDGTGDALYPSGTSADLALGSGDFTIEFWLYTPRGATRQYVLDNRSNGAGGFIGTVTGIGVIWGDNGSSGNGNQFRYFSESSGTVIADADLLGVTLSDIANQWNHIAIVRSSGTVYGFLNGVRKNSVADATNFNVNTSISIGAAGDNSAGFLGNMSNFRVVKGTAVYTGTTYTVPTSPLTAVSGTELLTCQSNRFVDNSTNNFAITRNGDVRIIPFSPFAPGAAYDASVNGGSGYFDGTGDTLTTAATTAFDFANNNFTIEAWIYITSFATSQGICANQNNGDFSTISGWVFEIGTNGSIAFRDYNNAIQPLSVVSSAGVIKLNNWHHVVVEKRGTGTNQVQIFVDGVAVASGTSNANIPVATSNQPFIVGNWRYSTDTNREFTGYMSNFRIVNSAVYNGTVTVPTAPLTAIANTSLLLNYTNAGIFDNTGKNNLETVADAQIDTTTKKYGTGSMEFDGTGDWLLMPNNLELQLGTGDFTIELWVYLATGNAGSNRGLVAKGTSTTGFLVSLNTTEKVVFTFATSTITSTGAITLDAWNHIAVVREGTGSNETKIYIAGTNDGTGTVSTDFNQTSVMYVGANRTGGDPMKGFIDDLRITKGVARYTTTFTPPTKAFPDL